MTAEQAGKLAVLCFDQGTGKKLWESSVAPKNRALIHSVNSPASPTAASDGSNFYVFFPDVGLISFDASGKERWQVPLGPFTSGWGMASSPVLVNGCVVLQLDGYHDSYIAAFDQDNGKLAWRAERDSLSQNYATPILRKTRSGRVEILASGPLNVIAYDATNGEKRWVAEAPGGCIIASLAMSEGTLFCMSYKNESPASFDDELRIHDRNRDGVLTPDEFGHTDRSKLFKFFADYMENRDGVLTRDKYNAGFAPVSGKSEARAIRLEDSADGSVRAHTQWSHARNVPFAPCPLVYDGVLYLVANGGIISTLHPKTGDVAKVGRLTGALGNYYASPVAADGKVYCTSEEGVVSVVKAGKNWEILSTSPLGEECYATPALSGGRVFIRTETSLSCFVQTQRPRA